jgi:hypothetical protein
VTPEALTAARADFVTAVSADELHRAGGHREALGWVLADLHAGWPLTYDYGPLTLAVAARPELARILVAVAGFTPARIQYDVHGPDGRYVAWQYSWPGTAAELWDTTVTVLGWTP